MNQEQATIIEQQHNVCVDAESEMCTYGHHDDTYGWFPVPDEWLIDGGEAVALNCPES